jgi:feruloyl esterase
LTELELAGASITSAVAVPAGPYTPPPFALPASPLNLAAHCRVQGVARPTGDSEIRFELWLPVAESWNGKYEQVGNGGWAGSVPIAPIAAGLARGYATGGTDGGHTGGNPAFAPGHPQKVVDFGHRAVHETAVQAKAVVQAFYGRPPSRSYFFGCSSGGREGLTEAQRYPDDFDGILAGAPANEFTRLVSTGVWVWKALNETPGSMIPPAKLPLVQAAAVAACDQVDGVKDGLIEDPRRCRFRPSALRCAGPDRADCLTAAQVTALEKIYAGPSDPRTGERIYRAPCPAPRPCPEAGIHGWWAPRRPACRCSRGSGPASTPTWCSRIPSGTIGRWTSGAT